jgi:hypothetical protein
MIKYRLYSRDVVIKIGCNLFLGLRCGSNRCNCSLRTSGFRRWVCWNISSYWLVYWDQEMALRLSFVPTLTLFVLFCSFREFYWFFPCSFGRSASCTYQAVDCQQWIMWVIVENFRFIYGWGISWRYLSISSKDAARETSYRLIKSISGLFGVENQREIVWVLWCNQCGGDMRSWTDKLGLQGVAEASSGKVLRSA